MIHLFKSKSIINGILKLVYLHVMGVNFNKIAHSLEAHK